MDQPLDSLISIHVKCYTVSIQCLIANTRNITGTFNTTVEWLVFFLFLFYLSNINSVFDFSKTNYVILVISIYLDFLAISMTLIICIALVLQFHSFYYFGQKTLWGGRKMLSRKWINGREGKIVIFSLMWSL